MLLASDGDIASACSTQAGVQDGANIRSYAIAASMDFWCFLTSHSSVYARTKGVTKRHQRGGETNNLRCADFLRTKVAGTTVRSQCAPECSQRAALNLHRTARLAIVTAFTRVLGGTF